MHVTFPFRNLNLPELQSHILRKPATRIATNVNMDSSKKYVSKSANFEGSHTVRTMNAIIFIARLRSLHNSKLVACKRPINANDQ